MTDKNNNTKGYEKMSDKEFYLKLALSLISIVGCVGMMISSALALFTSEIKSTANTIKTGHFDVVVTSSCGCTGDGGVFTACTADRDEHTFIIEPDGTVEGYAKIIADGNGNRVEQYTEQLYSPITVRIAAMPGTTIRFKSYWGKVENVESVRALLAKDDTFIYHSLTPAPEEKETTETSENVAEENESIESNGSNSVADEGTDSSEDTQTTVDDNSDTGSEDVVNNSSNADSDDKSNDGVDNSSDQEELSDDESVVE